MKEKNLEKGGKACQKCKAEIGGKAYYLVQLDCIYDGKSISACESVVVCSDCYHRLRSWLGLPN
jgi:hypothetical protein